MPAHKKSSQTRSNNQVLVQNYVRRRFHIRSSRVAALGCIALSQLGYQKALLSVVFVSDPHIKRLNQRYLNHGWATDVLAFPFSEGKRLPKRKAQFLGEIIISPQRAHVQAKRWQATFSEELARYVMHGILHLSGLQDKTARQKTVMRRTENRLLALAQRSVRRV